MATRNLTPRATGEGSVGTSVKKWLAGWFGTLTATTVNTGSVVATGNVGAATYTGDGSGLTGIGSGTGGVINTGSTTIGADSDVNGSGEIALQIGGVTKATVTNTGNVGIGTVTPGDRLDVAGAILTSGGLVNNQTSRGVFEYNPTSGKVAIRAYGATAGTGILAFNIGGGGGSGDSEAMRITNTGNVGIGTVTPGVQFELSGSIGQKASGTTWSNPSDARLKDIQGPADLQRCYDDVKALPLLRYTLKSDCLTSEQAADRTVTGFTANDIQKVIPKAVNVVPFSKVPVLDGVEEYQEEVKNEDGTVEMVTKTRPKYITEVIEDCLNLDMSQVYMQMFGAVQMLQQKVEELKAEMDLYKATHP